MYSKDTNTDRDLKFIAFGSEERGLLGAKYYVDQLTQAERDNIDGRIQSGYGGDKIQRATNLVRDDGRR